MEIFVGTYMRRWLCPCEGAKHLVKNLEIGLFKSLRVVFVFLFLVPMPQEKRFFASVKLRYHSACYIGFKG